MPMQLLRIDSAPSSWLYVSKRLQLEWFPNDHTVWQLPVVLVSGPAHGDVTRSASVVYYRISARVLVWLEYQGVALEREYISGQLARDQIDAYLTAMGTVWDFSRRHLDPAEVKLVRGDGDVGLPHVFGPLW